MQLPNTHDLTLRGAAPALAALLLFLVYVGFSAQFYPTDAGGIGEDHPGFFVKMASAELFFREAGWWHVPWFMPSVCAGSFQFVNPIDITYSVPQLLSMLTNPLTAVFISHWLLAAIGGAATFALARTRPFSLAVWPALAVAVLFAYNGFFMARMVVGHLNFHTFMLAPLLPLLLLQRGLLAPITAGALAALVIYGGGVHVVVPIGLSTLMVLGLAALHPGGIDLKTTVRQTAIATIAAGLLAAAKLAAAISLNANFPRTLYALQGIDSIRDAIVTPFASWLGLLSQVPDTIRGDWNVRFHELDYSLSPFIVPPLLLALWFASRTARTRLLVGAALFIPVLALLLALNTYGPTWHALLANVPVINSSSSLFRWYSAILLVVPVMAGLGLNQLRHRTCLTVCVITIVGTVGWQLARPLPWAALSPHDVQPVLQDLDRARERGATPITRLAVAMTKSGATAPSHATRDIQFMSGESQVFCYDALFGYNQELLRIDNIRKGPVLAIIGGEELNMKNPACYAYPDANECRPGDNFRIDQRDQLLQFTSWQAWSFEQPLLQRIANNLTLLSWFGFAVLCATALGRRLRGEFR